ncbi:putative BED zinc finger,hAT family dimerization domain [Hibiscus syriacus]|uniref:BED zinc finger,hAT family dimerization domain n=1 Tax=Hibiscus syriacus TaxID=106335 RepID=A0A6A2XU15_HIBSY|nr:putative BED zinc finger,hAT family dimerization domain [Hibiscus syriacus]
MNFLNSTIHSPFVPQITPAQADFPYVSLRAASMLSLFHPSGKVSKPLDQPANIPMLSSMGLLKIIEFLVVQMFHNIASKRTSHSLLSLANRLGLVKFTSIHFLISMIGQFPSTVRCRRTFSVFVRILPLHTSHRNVSLSGFPCMHESPSIPGVFVMAIDVQTASISNFLLHRPCLLWSFSPPVRGHPRPLLPSPNLHTTPHHTTPHLYGIQLNREVAVFLISSVKSWTGEIHDRVVCDVCADSSIGPEGHVLEVGGICRRIVTVFQCGKNATTMPSTNLGRDNASFFCLLGEVAKEWKLAETLLTNWKMFLKLYAVGAEVAVLCITKSGEVVNYQGFANAKGIYTVAETMPKSDRWNACLARPISSFHDHCSHPGEHSTGIKFTYNRPSGHFHTVRPFVYQPSTPSFCSETVSEQVYF